MRETTQNFLVGLTSIVAVVGVAYLLMRFGELDGWINARYALVIHTDQASGLRAGSVVEYNGVPIGMVDDVGIDTKSGTEWPVIVHVLIDEIREVPSDVRPYAITSLFGGSAKLELANKRTGSETPGASAFLPRDGTAVIRAPMRLQMIEQLTAELDTRMKPVIDALDSFRELSNTYSEVGKNINALLAPENEGDQRDLRAMLHNFNDVLTQVNEALVLAKEWLGDDALRTDVRGGVARANELISHATDTLDRYTRLADKLEANADDIVKGLLPITDEIAVTLEEVRRVAKLASEGQGTVAQLLNNPDLYKSLDDAAIRLERTLVEIQLYIEKVKAEGLDVKF